MNAKMQIKNNFEISVDQTRSWDGLASSMTLPIRNSHHLRNPVRTLLSDEQELALIRQIQTGDTRSLRKMIAHNMYLVVDLVRPYNGRDLPLLNLVKKGIEGLTHALKHFVPEGDTSFSSYATLCIYHRIELAIKTMDLPAAAHVESAAPFSSLSTAAHIGGQDEYTA